MMSKNKNIIIVTYIFILVLYAVIFLTVPFEKNVTTWLAFVFGSISILSGIIVAFVAFEKGESLKSKVYGIPIFRLGYYYTIVQVMLTFALFVAELFMDIPFWISLIFGLMLLGVFIIGLMALDSVKDSIELQESRDNDKTDIIESLRSDVGSLAGKCSNSEIKKALNKLNEDFKYSDPVSNSATKEIEEEIKIKISELSVCLNSDDDKSVSLVSEISELLEHRNRKCKDKK